MSWWQLAIKIVFALEAGSLIGLVLNSWRHQNDWPNHCRLVAHWKQHFQDNVSHGWIFNDGMGQ